MLICVQTIDGPRNVRVCDNCRTVCCSSRFCSGYCARQYEEFEAIRRERENKPEDTTNAR